MDSVQSYISMLLTLDIASNGSAPSSSSKTFLEQVDGDEPVFLFGNPQSFWGSLTFEP